MEKKTYTKIVQSIIVISKNNLLKVYTFTIIDMPCATIRCTKTTRIPP